MRRIVAARIRAHADRLARDAFVNLDDGCLEEGGASAEVFVRCSAVITRAELLAELARGLGGVEEHAAIVGALEAAAGRTPA